MKFDQLIADVKQLKKRASKTYIYGAGYYGQDIYGILRRNDITVDGFLVTKEPKEKKVLDLPVLLAKDCLHKNAGIILGVGYGYAEEILEILHRYCVPDDMIIDGGSYIEKSIRLDDLRYPQVLEVTTILGCKVNCKYCPQDTLVTAYFKTDKKRKRLLTPENFEIILRHIPLTHEIMFCGMSEPFLNPECITLLKMACESGRKVSLYTTLVGASEEDIMQTVELPLSYVMLHAPDKCGYADIPVTEAYCRSLKRILSAKKADGTDFVDSIKAQTDIDDRIAEMCEGRFDIMTGVHDRAGNLSDEQLQKRSKELSANEKISCNFCGPQLTSNVLLPDGTLLICGQDYGMQHILGNLIEDDYETIRKGSELKRVMRGLDGDSQVDLLCRKCICARAVS